MANREIDRLKAEVAVLREVAEAADACPVCNGKGTWVRYPNYDPNEKCDACDGSGNRAKIGPRLRAAIAKWKEST